MIFMNSGVWAPSRRSTNSYNTLINKDKIFPINAFMRQTQGAYEQGTSGEQRERFCAAAIGPTADRMGVGREIGCRPELYVTLSLLKS